MALTLSPYATGFPSDSLNTSIQPQHQHTTNMSRAVSVNMDNLASGSGGVDNPGESEQQYVEHLDMDMVANFGDPMGMGFGGATGEEHRGTTMVDPDLQHGSDSKTPLSAMHPPSTSHSHQSATQPTMDDMFHSETGLDDGSDDDDDSPAPASGAGKRRRETQDVPGGFTYVDKEGESGRRKIRIEYITDKSRRHITFSKRKAGIMKKAYELSILTGTQVLLLVVSETGLVYTFTTTKLQPLVTKAEGKNLIQACLNAPDGLGPDGQPVNTTPGGHRIRSGPLSIRPHKLSAEAAKAMLSTAAQVAGATPDEAEAHAAAQTHANQQAKAVAALGNGSPRDRGQRPIKRIPSNKRMRTASSQSVGGSDLPQPELIPPVPSIPDMHRQPSPSTHLLPHGQPPTPNPLQSPLTAGYHIPPEYQQHPPHPHGMPSPTYGYPPTPTAGVTDYGVPHPGMPGYGYPQAPPQQHQNFLVHQPMYQSQHQQPPPTEPRRMMPDNGGPGGMRMGM